MHSVGNIITVCVISYFNFVNIGEGSKYIVHLLSYNTIMRLLLVSLFMSANLMVVLYC